MEKREYHSSNYETWLYWLPAKEQRMTSGKAEKMEDLLNYLCHFLEVLCLGFHHQVHPEPVRVSDFFKIF